MIEYKENYTYINGLKVSVKWHFVSDGTWFKKGSIVVLQDEKSDFGAMGGLFRGIRVCEDNPNEKNMGYQPGQEREDGEVCSWEEFDIYNENGILLKKSTICENSNENS